MVLTSSNTGEWAGRARDGKLTLSPDFDESESQTTNKRPELETRIQPLACQAKYNGRGKKEQKKGGKATQGEWTAKQSKARLDKN